MSIERASKILRKDLALGPRSPVFLYALVFPVLATILVQLVFGGLFDPEPRLGVVDEGRSEVTASLRTMDGIELILLEDETELRELVRENSLDAGLVLSRGFDEMVRSGEKPALEFFVGGESLASNRLILSVTTIDLVRQVEGTSPPVDVVVTTVGEADTLSFASRLVPLLVLMALLIAGIFVTALSLVEEKEQGTLGAVLVTPASIGDVVVAKSTLGLVLSMLMAFATLALNGALGSAPGALILALFVGALMSVEIGIIYGAASRDTQMLFTLIKTVNIILVAPVVFYLFPDWPQWVAKIFPTYWFLDPVVRVALEGAGLAEVWKDLVVAVAICAALLPVIWGLSRRMVANLGAA